MVRISALVLPTLLLAQSAHASPLTLTEVVRVTLERHPSVRIQQRQVDASYGAVLSAGAPFDTIVNAEAGHRHTELPLARGERVANDRSLTTDNTSLALGSVTGTRVGTTIAPVITVERINQRRVPDVPMLPDAFGNRATVGVQLTQSLLRNAGRTRAAGEELGSKHQARAAEQDARFVGSQRVLDSVTAYWRLAAARRQVELLSESEVRAAQLVEDTRALIKGNQRPAADLRQVEGNLADRRRGVIQVRAAEYEAQRLLGLAMGVPADQIEALAELAHALPARPADAQAMLLRDEQNIALTGRADLASAEAQTSAADVRRAAADGNRLPQLDLNVGAGYSGLAESLGLGAYLASFGRQVPGPTVNVSLRLELPVLNKAREGAFQQRRAEHAITVIARDEQRRQILTRLRVAHNNLLRSVEALTVADEAASLYLLALEDERAKLKAGLSTIIDVVVIQDRLLQVQLNQLSAQLGYAESLAEYCFQLGALPENAGENDDAHLAPLLGPRAEATP